MLPDLIAHQVTASLSTAGDTSPIRQITPIPGGAVSTAVRLRTDQAAYFLKWHQTPEYGSFGAEMQGLELIRKTGTIHVPLIFGMAEVTQQIPGFILQEWIEARSSTNFTTRLGGRLGAQLAAMHHASVAQAAPGYGWGDRSSVDPTLQWSDDWIAFFRDQLFVPRMQVATRLKLLSIGQQHKFAYILEHLDKWLGGVERQPTLLHGDLHQTNILCDQHGEPVLIDPWWFYGDREYDLAGPALWGDFAPDFFSGYNEVWSLPVGYADRRKLYQLALLVARRDEHFRRQIDPILELFTAGTRANQA
jgi:fructosamine-3-kinase